jgi:glucan phosphoethanolaminetransferase (alkaline phosphatase superfamily)
MALKLFRSTGYSSILMPGESRVGTHPLWLVFGASLWLALACNVGIWRLVAGSASDVRGAAASVLLIAGAAGLVLSIFSWRRLLRFMLTLALIAGALVACGLWSQELPIDTLWHGPSSAWLPAWASFLRWQVLLLLLVLAVVPIVWLWNVSLRRLSAGAQIRSSMVGAILAVVVFGAGLAALG